MLRQRVILEKHTSIVNFSSNDYLNLSTHPEVIRAFQEAANEYGLGSTASPLVSGYSRLHQQVEEEFANFLKRDQAILFNSGYHANLGVITTFANRRTRIITDKQAHASLIDGIVLSRAKCKRYRHHDLDHAEKLLSARDAKSTLFITESVFSITGHITAVKRCAQLAEKYRAMLIMDDAHGIGILGERGGGVCDQDRLPKAAISCLITPLGKAIGSLGAVVSGSKEMIHELVQSARTYRYSTALPPALCGGTLAALKVLQKEPWRREKLHQLIAYFNQAASLRHLPLISYDATPIKSILIGENEATVALQKILLDHGYAIACIRPPTVPLYKACLRISLASHHREEQITRLLDLIAHHHDRKN